MVNFEFQVNHFFKFFPSLIFHLVKAVPVVKGNSSVLILIKLISKRKNTFGI